MRPGGADRPDQRIGDDQAVRHTIAEQQCRDGRFCGEAGKSQRQQDRYGRHAEDTADKGGAINPQSRPVTPAEAVPANIAERCCAEIETEFERTGSQPLELVRQESPHREEHRRHRGRHHSIGDEQRRHQQPPVNEEDTGCRHRLDGRVAAFRQKKGSAQENHRRSDHHQTNRPPPPDKVSHHAAKGKAEQRHNGLEHSDGRHLPACLGALETVADDHPSHCHACGGPEPLEYPHGNQHFDACGKQGAKAAQHEQQRSVDKDRPASDAVRQGPGDQLADAEHDEKGAQDELRLVGRRHQVVAHLRDRGRQDRDTDIGRRNRHGENPDRRRQGCPCTFRRHGRSAGM